MTARIRKPVKRVTDVLVHEAGRDRAIVVELNPTFISFRLAGTRTAYTLGVEGLYYKAVLATVEADQREKRKLKKARRKGGRQ